MKNALTPRKKIQVEGKVSYSESSQAWNIIKLKKELFEEFPQLKEKRASFSYRMEFFRDEEELDNFYKRFKGSKEKVMPILMFLYKEEK